MRWGGGGGGGGEVGRRRRGSDTRTHNCIDKGTRLRVLVRAHHPRGRGSGQLLDVHTHNGQIRKLPVWVMHPWQSQVPWAPLQGLWASAEHTHTYTHTHPHTHTHTHTHIHKRLLETQLIRAHLLVESCSTS